MIASLETTIQSTFRFQKATVGLPVAKTRQQPQQSQHPLPYQETRPRQIQAKQQRLKMGNTPVVSTTPARWQLTTCKQEQTYGKKQVSAKIPPVVAVQPAENFRLTQTTISSLTTKEFLIEKSGSFNHLVLLENKQDYSITKDILAAIRENFGWLEC